MKCPPLPFPSVEKGIAAVECVWGIFERKIWAKGGRGGSGLSGMV